MRAALLEGGVVANVIVVEPEVLGEHFPDAIAVPDDLPVAIGWSYAEEGFVAPPVVAPEAGQLRAYAASRRYAVETGGLTVDGATIATDRDSQSLISGAYAYVQAASVTTVSFKSQSGWLTLTAEEIKTIALAVGNHVQACFAAERSVDDAIGSGSITTYAQIDAAAWPTA